MRIGLLILAVLLGAVAWGKAPFVVGARENVVILGDSITADGRYAELVQRAIDATYPERQIHVISSGASGDTVPRAVARLESDVVVWRPSWVIINLGINDLGQYSVDEYLQHYENLLNRITRDTGAQIAIMSFIYPDRDAGLDRKKAAAFVAGIKALAARYHCRYLPGYETFRAIRPTLPKGVMYAPDGIHPNLLGYHIFSEVVLAGMAFPLANATRELSLPDTRVAPIDDPGAPALIGTQFTLALPQPIHVTVTPYTPPTTSVPRAGKPVKIDGQLDEWDLTNPLVIDQPAMQVGGTLRWGFDRRATGRAYTSYDDMAWYCAIMVETPQVIGKPVNEFTVTCDCVEVMVDLRTSEERAAANTTTFAGRPMPRVAQYVLFPAVDGVPASVEVGGGDKAMKQDVTVASSLTKTGYILEMSVPAHLFANGVIPAGATYGLDITIDDVDRYRRWPDLVQMRWSGSQYSFFSTAEYGKMTLSKDMPPK